MKDYNATIELDAIADHEADDQVDALMEQLTKYHGVVGRSPRGWLEVTITVPGEDLQQATSTAYAVTSWALQASLAAGGLFRPVAAQVMTTEEFDARADMTPMPSLIGTADAAEILGVSQQRVVQLVDAGQLSSTRAGRALALSRTEVEAFSQRERKTGRPAKRG